MELKAFSKGVKIIADNFGFKLDNEDWIKMLFNMAKEFTGEDIKHGFQEICRISGEEWNKRYGYRGKPPIADWVALFKRRKEREELDAKMLEIDLKAREGEQKTIEDSSIKYVSAETIKQTINNLTQKED